MCFFARSYWSALFAVLDVPKLMPTDAVVGITSNRPLPSRIERWKWCSTVMSCWSLLMSSQFKPTLLQVATLSGRADATRCQLVLPLLTDVNSCWLPSAQCRGYVLEWLTSDFKGLLFCCCSGCFDCSIVGGSIETPWYVFSNNLLSS